MGFLTDGRALPWEEATAFLNYVRDHGIAQFVATYLAHRSLEKLEMLWGDEVEYMIVVFDAARKRIALSLRAPEILAELEEEEQECIRRGLPPATAWRPEYGRHMVEGTPGQPFGGTLDSLADVEPSMRRRRQELARRLRDGEFPMTISSFFLLGSVSLAEKCTEPPRPIGGPISESCYVSDDIINPHPRFGTLTANIRKRRGKKVSILVPAFKETEGAPAPAPRRRCSTVSVSNTGEEEQVPGFLAHYSARSTAAAADFQRSSTSVEALQIHGSGDDLVRNLPGIPPSIHMDAMAFGMGCCCLQATMQARNIDEARFLYDQLAVLCPVFLALSASTPILRGFLAETDARWHVISASVDDRTDEERTSSEATDVYIPKSRYDSISTFISTACEPLLDVYNDYSQLRMDPKYYAELRNAGIDDLLAKHVAHLFIRDPLVIYENKIEIDDAHRTDHFENIQSTNWQTVRFKPPPPGSDIGWRVEFRVTEVQLTDFENAAFITFVILLARILRERMRDGLNFYMPISLVDRNMARAHVRDAVLFEKFFFRTNVMDGPSVPPVVCQLTVNEIINGTAGYLPPHQHSHRGAHHPSQNRLHQSHLYPHPNCDSRSNDAGLGDASSQNTLSVCSPTSCSSSTSSSHAAPATDAGVGFMGLVPLVREYLAERLSSPASSSVSSPDDGLPLSPETCGLLDRYLTLISKRASGELMTAARFMRSFVRSHEDYRFDSRVSEKIAYELADTCRLISAGELRPPLLLGTSCSNAGPFSLSSVPMKMCRADHDRAVYADAGRMGLHGTTGAADGNDDNESRGDDDIAKGSRAVDVCGTQRMGMGELPQNASF